MGSGEELFAQKVLEQAPDAVLVAAVGTERSGPTVAYVNAAFTQLTGYAPQEVQGKSLRFLDSPHTRRSLHRELQQVMDSAAPSRWRDFYQRQGGEEFLAETAVAPMRDPAGHVTHWVAVLRDVTAMWQVEEALRQNERLLQHIADTLPAILFIYELGAGSLSFVSREVQTLIGHSPHALTHGEIPPEQLLHPGDRPQVEQQMLQLRRAPEGALVETECRALHRNGDWRWLLLRTTVFDRLPDGSARQLVGVAVDVTESRRLREQLAQSSKLESLGRLAGGIAHDFNNLLTVIQSYAEIMHAALPPDHPVRAHVEPIVRAAEQASQLTSQMLAFARRRIISPQVLAMNDLVQETEQFLRRLLPENIVLDTSLQPDLWQVYADPTQLEQVLLNLTLNARDAMPAGGRLTIETANVVLDESYAARHAEVKPGEYVMLAVSDTGIGMDERTLARVFEPFFTTKEAGKGTGLGLSTCYGIVKQAGGSIWVYSEPDEGTTFKVYLPRAGGTPAALPAPLDPVRPTGGDETVLIVEDNEAVREVAVAALQAQGYRVLQATDGEQALALVQHIQEEIHLLVTDVVMPGMSGAVLATGLRERIPALKVLYTSGYTENVIVHHGVLEEGIAFLPKPYRPSDLARRVREVLDAA